MADALSKGGDNCDLYFEHSSSTSVLLTDGKVNQASTHVSIGMGVRVRSGDQVGYAYSEDLSPAALRNAARTAAGIARERVIFDPGFGFGKTAEHNFHLLAHLRDLCLGGHPILVGLSRKSMIASVLDRAPGERVYASVALALMAVERGASIVRVHDVAATADALAMWGALPRSIDR